MNIVDYACDLNGEELVQKINELNEKIKEEPNNFKLFSKIAYLYEKNNEHLKCINSLLTAIHLNNKEPGLYFQLAFAQYNYNYVEDALKSINLCLKISDDLNWSYYISSAKLFKARCLQRITEIEIKKIVLDLEPEVTLWIDKLIKAEDYQKIV
jgi:tetratricopeptide (TPR) repeat protein